jgi:four helix bundle protein
MLKDKPHKKLDVWQKSIRLVEEIYRLASLLPRSEEFGISNQIKRSAVSLAANIAEGAARQTKREFIQYLHMSQGSLSELDTHLEILDRLGFIQKHSKIMLSALMGDIDKMITRLIRSLKISLNKKISAS